jgi:two-component system, chemotaxis family, response regulator Rcp1
MTAAISKPAILIMVAEDSHADVTLIRHAFKQHQLESELLVMDDGQAAIEYIHRVDADNSVAAPDLLLLDLNLPKANGEEVLAQVRQSHKCVRMPVMIISSSGSIKDREMAARLGATVYFQKPSGLEEFMRIGALAKEMLAG